MIFKISQILIAFLLISICSDILYASEDKISQYLFDSIHLASYKKSPIRIWVYFKDKDSKDSKFIIKNKKQIKRLKRAGIIGYSEEDVDVKKEYIGILKENDFYPVAISRWLNAASYNVPANRIAEIEKYEFVEYLDIVKSYIRKPDFSMLNNQNSGRSDISKHSSSEKYGKSTDQLKSVNFPITDDLGFSGKDVRICILDAGYNTEHESLRYCKIISSYDFISMDLNISQQKDDEFGITDHGTAVLSIMSGYLPGKMIGPAYNSDFILARTEEIDSSNSILEDIWISAIEWADSLGTEIILSSVGVMLEQMFNDYSFHTNIDNNRNPIYKILKIAADRGILFVSDAPANYDETVMWDIKNSGLDMLLVQSSSDSWENLDLARFPGWEVSTQYNKPTTKRLLLESIESDLYAAEAGGDNFYGWRKGSSYLAALTAASAAVIMEAHPDWNPVQVLDAIRTSNVEKEDEGQIIGSQDTFLDIFNALNALFPSASGDLDGNGRVDGNDLALFSELYMKNSIDNLKMTKAADLDGNLIIDGNDLAILARKFANN